MDDKEFFTRWKQQLQLMPEYVYPWEHSKLPEVPQNTSDEDVIEYLKIAKPLINKARWWYFCMKPVRAWKSVWKTFFGKIVIVVGMLCVYFFHAFLHLVILQEQTNVARGDVFLGQKSIQHLLWPWKLQKNVESIIERYDRSISLYYQAQTIPWNIEKTIGVYNVAYPILSDSYEQAYRYRSIKELDTLESHILSSLQRKKQIDDMTKHAAIIGWTIEIAPPYLDATSIDKLEQQITNSTSLHPLVVDYENRALEVQWDIKSQISRYPYIKQQLEDLRVELEFYEQHYSQIVDVNQRMKAMNWIFQISPPYTQKDMVAVLENIKTSEQYFASLSKLLIEGQDLGWTIHEHNQKTGLTPRYTKELIQRIESRMKEMRRVKKRVDSAVVKAQNVYQWNVQLSIPYQEKEIID